MFSVQALGVKVGNLHLTSEEAGPDQYAVAATFQTTGLAGALRRVGFTMKSHGTGRGLALSPLVYQEDMRTGRRSSSARLEYSGGVPQTSGGGQGVSDAVPADPAAQSGTLDPMTALYLVLRDQPRDQVCRLDRAVFDGARRTRVVLTRPVPADGGIDCVGRFIREAGYTPAQMAERRAFDLQLSYRPGPGGLLRLTRARVQSIHGPVLLIRR